MTHRAHLLGFVIVLACGNGVGPPSTTGGSTAASSTGGSETTASVSTGSPTSSSTGSVVPTSTAPSDSSFIHDPGPDLPPECDPYAQSCPPGEKCTWYAGDGGNSWTDTKCVPIMEDPAQIDEDCFVVDNGVSG